MRLIELGGDPPIAVIELSQDEARSLGALLYQDVSVGPAAASSRVEADAANIEQREPYRTALEVLDSPDPEAELAKLHPEWRDAVRMLIGPTHG